MKTKILILFICFSSSLYGQNSKSDNNFVLDTVLYNKLFNYLLEHPRIYTKDSNGKLIPFSRAELEERFEDVAITTRNLKIDTINTDKSVIGIYRFGYASISDPPWLYIQHKDRIEFIDLDKEDLDVNQIIRQISSFFKKNEGFTEKEKLMMAKGVMETAYSNIYGKRSW